VGLKTLQAASAPSACQNLHIIDLSRIRAADIRVRTDRREGIEQDGKHDLRRSGVKELTRQRLLDFLEEDLGRGDVTSRAVVPHGTRAAAHVFARQAGVIAGIDEALILGEIAGLVSEPLKLDGEVVAADEAVVWLDGAARDILGIERTLLNLLGHMSGIATQAREAAESVKGTRARVAATRKTLPGLRWFEKRAVQLGGADPHRFELADSVLIKDNHLVIVGDVAEAVRRGQAGASFTQKIEVEVESLDDAMAAAGAGADALLLDNMSPTEISSIVTALEGAGLRSRVILEASGGISIAELRQFAETGVDVISLGALTSSAPFFDFSLEISTP
jgi:nicotinate-nucleotide pyrophosphorylase (carboxylating)